ncbi:DUF402 domain-containing protein [Planococcus lenghuensis]|uniref:DUF402 domain-containing protein n=1 Tax=Planococcus lenghuensis TaxID=2213202 RepID=A0A1Q2KWR3_9BACL|nr:DUF402 domain-containing protein [Planococcus lenghuensis]AQQ52630.1 hypothetical protein B0X71_05640 [Planococcus lenghuensis]
MLEKKFGDRNGWERIKRKETAKTYIETEEFVGYVTLFRALQVTEPLEFEYRGQVVRVLGDGYTWLQHFPEHERYSLTTMFDENGKVVQWYIDVCRRNGVENDRPFMEDLFLDIIVLPDGEVLQVDTADLEQALEDGVIGEDLYETSWNEMNRIYNLVENNEFKLLKEAKAHREHLLRQLS